MSWIPSQQCVFPQGFKDLCEWEKLTELKTQTNQNLGFKKYAFSYVCGFHVQISDVISLFKYFALICCLYIICMCPYFEKKLITVIAAFVFCTCSLKTRIHKHTCKPTSIHTQLHTQVYKHKHTYIYKHICTCKYTNTHTNIQTYTHTYTYTHTQKYVWAFVQNFLKVYRLWENILGSPVRVNQSFFLIWIRSL